jgi:hypothetical protein
LRACAVLAILRDRLSEKARIVGAKAAGRKRIQRLAVSQFDS